ncbi:efflux RND transporter periplasmic adaptor subunit [Halodesulfovibrio aestuarii]|uniref:Membrane fusion protein, multidrug efflux system n=1 Tax=Halodesulfovibrio aestuarii TaxID=126333 RepID=A0A8G2CA59_9BACT|nr:efflux RND transporter periplasmic adaptor subunit [Halodesulfovibrio aestuarii]SHJ26604.1 membrane fusion protein, multidrug efflux system [Halodesulfovibrio aestuarii]
MTACYYQRMLSLTVCCMCLLILTACSGNGEQQQQPAPDVDVVAVHELPVANKWDAVGRVDSKDIVQIKSRVEGFLLEQGFVEGDIVEKDQVLFKIDPKPFEAELLLAKANVEKTQAALVEAKLNLMRGTQLYAGKNISKSKLDAYTSTERQAAAEVDAAKARVYSATINLGYTTISAPFKGRISKITYSVGNLISPSSGTLATIYSIDPIYVYFTVDEKDVVTYRSKWGYGPPPNLKYMLKLPNGERYKLEGKLDFAQPFINKDTGTVELRCIFPNPDNLLISGMYVSVIVEDAEKKNMPVIPQSAVQQNQSGYTVIVVDKNNIATSRKVTLGMRLDAMWVVTSGVTTGERIIVEGLQKVQQGKPVTPHNVTIDSKTGVITKRPKKGVKGAVFFSGKEPAGSVAPSEDDPQKNGSPKTFKNKTSWTDTAPRKDQLSNNTQEPVQKTPVRTKSISRQSNTSNEMPSPSTTNSGS